MPAYFVEQRHQSLAKMGWYTFFSFAGMAVMAALGGVGRERHDPAGWQPGYRAEMVYNCRFPNALYRTHRRAIFFFDDGRHSRGRVALGTGTRDGQLLGDHPDVVPRRYHRTYGGRPELRSERGRYRCAYPYGLAEAADRQL